MLIGVNGEFVRHADRSFEYAVEKAAQMGYEAFEPILLDGRDLLAEAGYYHAISMDEDAFYYRDFLASFGMKFSGVSAHAPLMRPDVGVPFLRRAIRFAYQLGAPVVNTDEGIKPKWMGDEEAFQIMKYSLTVVLQTAERYGIYIGIEPHNEFTTNPETLERILHLVDSPFLRVNFDTGNSFISGHDPYKALEAVVDRVIHVHAKDIGGALLDERGKVHGTPVGVACGDGVIDWERVMTILSRAGYQGVLSVECGTEEQAERSLQHLFQLRKKLGL
ncbi:MAG: sugar phosphate isomerase/epimerase [Atribacterota bacterium]|nr:sugar phosphate isomerase/epimerase [Atribacterota bacterium]